MILAGDVGGTNLRLALFEPDAEGRLSRLRLARYETAAYAGLRDAVRDFCDAEGIRSVEAAGFGVAGPVTHGRARLTNSALEIDARRVSEVLGGVRVRVLNDLEATAYGLLTLPPSSFAPLLAGAPDAAGHRAVIAAGTGLGEALLVWDGARHLPVATEGGHVEFAPRTALEQDLLSALWAAGEKHVSYEDVVSGMGLGTIYAFLSARGEHASAEDCDPSAHEDPNYAITNSALAGDCPLCSATLALFCSVYGAEAGNLALKAMARGGVVLAGGIAPRIVDLLRGPEFREAFFDKGRCRALMESIPVSVCLETDAGLLGAAVAATAA